MVKKLDLSPEEKNRILIEKEKAITETEIRYHTKSVISLIDKLKANDPSYSDVTSKEIIKFILARQGNSQMYEEIMNYIENLQESFFDKIDLEY